MDPSLSEKFERFSNGSKDSSPLYSALSKQIANDQELLKQIDKYQFNGQPPHLLFLYSIHFLLLQGTEHELSEYYPSVTDTPKSGDPFPSFRSFCFEYDRDIAELIKTRKVQTNEIRRSTCLLPAFCKLNEIDRNKWTFIEIGCSAGLNLFWDQYQYRYDGTVIGNSSSDVLLKCEIRGNNEPTLSGLPRLERRIGIDLNYLDLTEKKDQLWLQGMIWPDQLQRLKLLQTAIDETKDKSVDIRIGDALDVLPDLLEELPRETNICLYQSITLYLFSEEDRKKLVSILKDESEKRVIYFISMALENPLEGKTELLLESYNNGQRTVNKLADCHYHGKWLRWNG